MYIKANEQPTLHDRIQKTLRLAEERGYNLTIPQLTQKLIGGKTTQAELQHVIQESTDFEYDTLFIATKNHLYKKKCHHRHTTHPTLYPIYNMIAQQYIHDYTRLCPWVHCILLSGSMASEGLDQGDDIDFDIIVHDGFKYASYLIGLLLGIKYSLRYGKKFWRRYVICLSVIWEKHQVLPFQRKDEQLAFELLNAHVFYNQPFYNHMITHNPWLTTMFPQIIEKTNTEIYTLKPTKKYNITVIHTSIERFSKNILFMIIRIAMNTIFRDHNMQKRMMVKHPYTLFDVPKK